MLFINSVNLKTGEKKKLRTNPEVEGSAKFAHDGDILCMAISSDGLSLATGGNDKSIKIWNIKTLQYVDQFKGHTGSITGLAFQCYHPLVHQSQQLQQMHQLYSCSKDRTVKIWDAKEMTVAI